MFEIIFLATGGSVPPKNRGLNSTLIRSSNVRFLVDCGDGLQYPLFRFGGNLGDSLNILITHDHFDHLIGLGGLLYTLDIRGTPGSVEIYSGEATSSKVKTLLDISGIHRGLDVKMIKVNPGTIWENDVLRCIAFKTEHSEDSFGYVFEEKERRHFIESKATELGIPFGKMRNRIISGETVSLPDGRLIEPDMVLSEPEPGLKMVYIGDTVYNDELIGFCQGADCIIAEATYLESDKMLAETYKHLTARQAGHIAREAEAKELYLNHISARYDEKDIYNEAKLEFPMVNLASDHQVAKITRKK